MSTSVAKRLLRGPRTWVVAGTVVLIVGLALSWWLRSGTTSTGARPASSAPASPVVPTGSAKLSVSPSGQVLGLPLFYPVINAVVPSGVKWEGPGADDLASGNMSDQLNIWGDFSS